MDTDGCCIICGCVVTISPRYCPKCGDLICHHCWWDNRGIASCAEHEDIRQIKMCGHESETVWNTVTKCRSIMEEADDDDVVGVGFSMTWKLKIDERMVKRLEENGYVVVILEGTVRVEYQKE